MDYEKLLQATKKEDLIDLLMLYSEGGSIPLEPFILKADIDFTPEELKEIWNRGYAKASEYEDAKGDASSDLAASLLRDMGEFTLDKVMKYKDRDACKSICKMMVDKLQRANEIDGIGMYGDSEWEYGEVRDRIIRYLADEFGEEIDKE